MPPRGPVLKLKLSAAGQLTAAQLAANAAAASSKKQLTAANVAEATGQPPTPVTTTPKIKLKLGPSSITSSTKAPSSQKPKKPSLKITTRGKKKADLEVLGEDAEPNAAGSKKKRAVGALSEDGETPKKPKKKPPPKIATKSNKKRDFAAHSEDDDANMTQDPVPPTVATEARPPIKKIKLFANKTPTTPFIRVKAKGKPPPRPLGVGYDSEASDREEDPAIEEEFILRMQPGEDCDYLRNAVANKQIGLPRTQGGADVKMKFLTRDGRRAVVTVQGRHYAASLVDLPCIIEAMKSWDKKQFWKSADICQMLLVLGRIEKEEEAMEFPLPDDVDKATWQHAHGITPPMRHARKRRFRQRVSNRTIEAVEDEVERLLRADDACEGESTYEVLDMEQLREEQARLEDEAEDYANGEPAYDDEDDEDEDGYFEPEVAVQDGVDDTAMAMDVDATADEAVDEFAAALEQAWAAQEDSVVLPAAAAAAAAGTQDHPSRATESPLALTLASEASTPAAAAAAAAADDNESSDDEVDGDGDDDDDEHASDAELDEADLEQQAELARQREEIADLEQAIQGQMLELERVTNPILRNKVVVRVKSLRADLEMRKAAIGEGADE